MRQLVAYGICGALTTLVNFAVFALCSHVMLLELASFVAWVLSVLFAYVTNRCFVFESSATTRTDIFKECVSFFGSRIFTGFVDIVLTSIGVRVFAIDAMLVKIVVNVVIIVLNFVLGRLVFKSR